MEGSIGQFAHLPRTRGSSPGHGGEERSPPAPASGHWAALAYALHAPPYTAVGRLKAFVFLVNRSEEIGDDDSLACWLRRRWGTSGRIGVPIAAFGLQYGLGCNQVLLVPKKDGSWRMCIDCCAINKITIKYRHPIPRLNDMLDELSGAQLFLKINLKSGYHQIRMQEGDEWKTSFKTKYGLYEWLQVIGRSRSAFACGVRSSTKRGFVVSARGLEVDQEKVKAINEWLHPMNISRVQSFQWLASFYRRFVPNFSTIVAPLIDIRGDASRIGIRAVLTQHGRPIAYFSKKLNGATLHYPTYDKYALIQALETWQHYLWPKEFVIHTNHEALKPLRGQTKLNKPHAKWVEYLESFPYVIKYKKGKENIVANALSRRYALVNQLDSKLLGFEFLKDLYQTDIDFGEEYKCCMQGAYEKYYHHEGYLFREGKLCIPNGSVREVLVNEAHGGRLMATFKLLKYWPYCKNIFIGQVRPMYCLQESKVVDQTAWFVYAIAHPGCTIVFEKWLILCLVTRLMMPLTLPICFSRKLSGCTEYPTPSSPIGIQKFLATFGGRYEGTIIRKNLKSWEECLPHVEFTYNRTIHSATKHSPFEVVYGLNPITPLDLVPLPSTQLVHVDGKRKADFVKQLHQRVKDNIKRRTEQYVRGANKGHKRVVFKLEDWVWIHMHKERFPEQRKLKLQPKGDGPFQMLERINDNVYKIDLPSEYGVSASFKVDNLSPFNVGDGLGTNRLEEGRNDASLATELIVEPLELPSEPITRARAKRFQESISSYINQTCKEGVFEQQVNNSTSSCCNALQADLARFSSKEFNSIQS
ncbi:hypothetical protein CXB51_008105 [Gossypium anomalum]|uniref:Transposon Ty3-I Gag-Pol polyprotein n=1 Tax=Gossypium anomalum TaxID=47600 RepID=A0A8J6D7V0_9ROSI|nr:hypothetical protein CXB51_008105 [Gossypium anomalum]